MVKIFYAIAISEKNVKNFFSNKAEICSYSHISFFTKNVQCKIYRNPQGSIKKIIEYMSYVKLKQKQCKIYFINVMM